MIKESFLIAQENAGTRLDEFLERKYLNISRTRLRRFIEGPCVLVNSAISRPGYKLAVGDVVEVEIAELPVTAMIPEPIELNIIFEDEHLIVIDKPAGMLVHPNVAVKSGTLLNALCYHFSKTTGGTNRIRPGLVHRLDKNTSGIMVIGKTERAVGALSKQFRLQRVSKVYTALVHGCINEDEGVIEAPIGFDLNTWPRWQVMETGRPARTRYSVQDRFDRFTLLALAPETGRTNQIRIHCAHLGHPLFGDAVYGKAENERFFSSPQGQLLKLDRHFLHASQLSFRHPVTREDITFNVPLPAELSRLLESIGSITAKK